MRAVRTIAAVLVAAAIAITGCASYSSADRPSGPPPVPSPTHARRPWPDRFDLTRRDRQAQIYAAVLRRYLTSGDASVGAGHRFPQVFVLDHTVAGAGASGYAVTGSGPIPAEVQRAITGALAEVGPLTFVASGDEVIVEPQGCAHVRDDGILVTLGPVDGVGDRVQVGVNGFLACLGANSLTYSVQQTSSGWRVGGITALGPVA
jgi:hypothetical protein